jgi:hypothetical protein
MGVAKKLPVERAVLDGFEDIRGADVRRASEVGERAGDFEDPVMRSGGEIHFFHGVFEVAGAFGVQLATGFHQARVHRMEFTIPCMIRLTCAVWIPQP